MNATQADTYSTIISTTDIFIQGQPEPFSSYRVVARTADPDVFFVSETDSAYSIDNLPPPQPVAQLLEFPGIVVIMWETPDIPDFNEACIYRGTTPGFIPGEPLVCTRDPWRRRSAARDVLLPGPVLGRSRKPGRVQRGVVPDDDGGGRTRYRRNWRCFPPYPNPFNPRTTLSFTLPAAGHVLVAIYDARGEEVARLVDESLAAGAHTVDWDGRDAFGASMPSGTYFCRLTTPWGVETRKMSLLR